MVTSRKRLLKCLVNLGYSLETDTLNAADYGVPQNRRRAVILGKYGGSAPAMPKALDYKVTIWDAISDLAYLESGEGEEVDIYRYPPQSNYQKRMRAGSDLLYNHKATKHSDLAIQRLKMISPDSGKEVLPEEHLTKSIYSGTWDKDGKG